MCSVSIIHPTRDSLRVVMNRDERDDRPVSRPPVRIESPSGAALLTVDGLAGGAWMGVHRTGLVVCLLNRQALGDQPPQRGGSSRGMIIPKILQAGRPHRVPEFLDTVQLDALQPFTLVAADIHETVIMSWNGRVLNLERTTAVCCSSGLGDARVQGPRQSAWSEATKSGVTAHQQDAWHGSRSGNDSAAWVLMARAGARTVSRTVVEIEPTQIHLEDHVLDAGGAIIARYQVTI